MALLKQSEFSKLFGNKKEDRRFEIWLWFYLNMNHHANFNSSLFEGGANRELMANFINKNNINIRRIIEAQDKNFVSESTIKWIEDEQRQNNWIINHIRQKYSYAIFETARLAGRNRVIATIDTLFVDLNQKTFFINNLQNLWIKNKQEDAIFDWFKQENQELRYKIAQEFSIKKFTEHTQSIFNTLQPISFCNHDDLLTFMDSKNLNLDEKKYWLDGVKKLYHQQQYRKNLKGKKQYNFILPESTIAKLDGLVIQYSLSRAEIIELLIKMEATKPTHIPERLRYVQNMTL